MNNEQKEYIFNPLEHGFEPISNYPELCYNFPLSGNWFIKIVAYSDLGGLVYWYKTLNVGYYTDDRVNIVSGSFDFRKLAEYGVQNPTSTVYLGTISSDAFAKTLLKHLFGTTQNKSVEKEGEERYNQNLGKQMREGFPQYYITENQLTK